MSNFASSRDAKEFLISKIVGEAGRLGVSLSDTERKMLYFSETAWTLPDILKVNEAFERDYDEAEYEEKIAVLVRGASSDAGERDTKKLEAWNEAVRMLRSEDHYLLVSIGVADGAIAPVGVGSGDGSWNRILRLVGWGGAIFLVGVALFAGYVAVRYLVIDR